VIVHLEQPEKLLERSGEIKKWLQSSQQ
jgi:hypothetical protein